MFLHLIKLMWNLGKLTRIYYYVIVLFIIIIINDHYPGNYSHYVFVGRNGWFGTLNAFVIKF